jgi:hypothetical protein
VIALAVLFAVALAVVVVWPLVVLPAELVVVLALVGARLALGRWTVVAESDRARMAWKVKGGRRADDLIRCVAAALANNGELPPDWRRA